MRSKDLNLSYLFDFYGELLSERQRDVFNLYYNDDLSLSEISAQIGITRQGVRDTVKKTETELINYENKLGLAKHFADLSEASNKIIEKLIGLAKTADSEESRTILNNLISEAEKIKEL